MPRRRTPGSADALEKGAGLRRFRQLLSGPPERPWPDAVVHHGARVLLLIVLAFAVHLLFPVVPVPDFPVLEKGMVSDKDIIAKVAFPIYKSETELHQEQEEATAGVPPYFEYQGDVVDAVLNRVNGFMAGLDSAATAARSPDSVDIALRAVLQASGFRVTDAAVRALRSTENRRLLRRSLDRAVETELPRGIASTSDLDASGAQQLRIRQGERDVLMSRDSILTQADLFNRASAYLPSQAPTELSELQRLVLIRFFTPTLRLNAEATEEARQRARNAVPTIKGEVMNGERIIGAHEQVRDAELERLRAYRDYLASLGQLGGGMGGLRAIGGFLFDLLLLGVFGLLLYFFRPPVYEDLRQVLSIAALIAALLAVAAIVGHNELPDELIPIALPALVVAALWDGRMALNLVLVLALLIGGQAPFGGVSVLYTMALGGAAASLSVRVVRRRAQTWIFVSIIAGAYAAAALTLGLLRSHTGTEILWSAAYGVLNAIGSGVVAMAVLPLFESFTRITTDQTLLELSDLNHPLLRRLSREAPGTFSHSLSVANLAEAAARSIGANALLTRVGVYYHDVGKLGKPQYFIENQPPGRNPHDKLKPQSSAAIVRNHVQEGSRLADEHKLPRCIKEFIAEHHGTQSISFFYDRAREQDPSAKLDPSQFAYPGPRPHSKETAIAMLADSVESAARVLPDPTPERIGELVDRIVGSKIRQRQLDEAPLTLRDLTEIHGAFVAVLAGMYHQRIDYPSAPTDGDGRRSGHATGNAAPGGGGKADAPEPAGARAAGRAVPDGG